MIAQSSHALATKDTPRVSPAVRVVILEQQAIEQLDHAHAIGDCAAALKAARMLDRIYQEVHAVLDAIESSP
jgi:hypothetical protein